MLSHVEPPQPPKKRPSALFSFLKRIYRRQPSEARSPALNFAREAPDHSEFSGAIRKPSSVKQARGLASTTDSLNQSRGLLTAIANGEGDEGDFSPSETTQTRKICDHPFPRSSSTTSIQTTASTKVGQLLPDTIECTLAVLCESITVGEPQHIAVKWNFPSSFKALDRAARDRLRSHGKNSTTQLYMKSGRCCLINDKTGEQHLSRRFEAQREWPETIAHMVTSFWSRYPDDDFHFDIRWEFSGLLIHREKGQTYADTIRQVIETKMRENWEDKVYIPRKDLDAIMSEATVAELVAQDESLRTPELAAQNGEKPLDKATFINHVAGFASILLAIFVYVDLPLICLHKLIRDGFEDINLPLPVKGMPCPNPLFNAKWRSLKNVQGGFIAHAFKDDGGKPKHDELGKQIVIPLTEHALIGQGSFGEVFEVSIDSDHHFFSNDKTERFALKRFFDQGTRTKVDFQNEAKMLGVLSKLPPHDNITRHLALWTQNDRFYMLFPRAEKNLRTFITETSHPTLDRTTVLWLLGQFKGLADGVRQIHNLGPSGLGPAFLSRHLNASSKRGRSGFHHDLKPENILVFADSYASTTGPITGRTWKISDFGSARIGLILSGSGMQEESYFTNNLSHGDAVYGAPDFVLEGKTSRPYDMWSLGCIFLECLLWAFGTPGSGLDEFAAQRLKTPEPKDNQDTVFWYMGTDYKVRLKPAVVDQLKVLKQNCEGRGVFKLLVSCIGKLLTIKPNERTDAPNLYSELDAMLQQAELDLDSDPHYYLQRDFSRMEGQVAAPPTTVAEEERQSIDERSVHAPHGKQFNPNPEHHRSFSQGSLFQRRSRPNGHADISLPITPAKQRKVPSLPNGASSLSPVQTQEMHPASRRSRSPSISVSIFEDTSSPLQAPSSSPNDALEPSPPVGWQGFPFRHDDYMRPHRSHSRDSRGSPHSSRSFTFPQ